MRNDGAVSQSPSLRSPDRPLGDDDLGLRGRCTHFALLSATVLIGVAALAGPLT